MHNFSIPSDKQNTPLDINQRLYYNLPFFLDYFKEINPPSNPRAEIFVCTRKGCGYCIMYTKFEREINELGSIAKYKCPQCKQKPRWMIAHYVAVAKDVLDIKGDMQIGTKKVIIESAPKG